MSMKMDPEPFYNKEGRTQQPQKLIKEIKFPYFY